MKQFIVLLLAWALAISGGFAASEEKGDKVSVKIEKGDMPGTVVVRLVNLEKVATHVTLQNAADGYVCFSQDVIQEEAFATKFNLVGMPYGDYIFCVQNRHHTWVKAFSMNTTDIVFFETPSAKNQKEGTLFSSISNPAGLSVKVLLANLQKRPATIRFITVGDGPIISKSINGEYSTALAFDLTGVQNGEYFLYVRSFDSAAVQVFTIANDAITFGEKVGLPKPKAVVKPEPAVPTI